MSKTLTLTQLKNLTLKSQGLLQPSAFGQGYDAVLHAIEHLGYLQIDTLAVVERAHHHTLWSRIPNYQASYLDDLIRQRQIFEYWFHAASYLPMQDFRFSLPQMHAVKNNDAHYYKADAKIIQYVMDSIRLDGPKKARDFENQQQKNGNWWNWKPAKVALERLFLQGDLMVCERQGMQKTYDIAERVLPKNIDLSMPNPLEFAEYLVKTYLRAYGWTTVKQITHLKTDAVLKKNINDILNEMLLDGAIQKIDIDGLPSIFIQSNLVDQNMQKYDMDVRLLSPFDNSIIHRDRVKNFFDFDYRLECYIPKEKRQYGYFCLPILFQDQFIGRIDCKAHRKDKQLEIIHLHIENQDADFELWFQPFVDMLKKFAVFNGCETIIFTQVKSSQFINVLKQAF